MPASTDFQSVELKVSCKPIPIDGVSDHFPRGSCGKICDKRRTRRGRRSGELLKATRWRTNKNQNTKEPAELQL